MKEIDILKKYDFKFNKNFGQNFIFDTNLLKAIVSDSGASNLNVLEIGCGAGTLTNELAKVAKKVVGYEIDINLMPILQERFQDNDKVEIVFKDIMKTPIEEIENKFDGEYIIVANLPYYITTPIIFKFVEEATKLKSLTIMVQKEVGDRLTAKPSSKDYGSITVSLNYRADVKVVRIIKRNMFTPAPNVDSCIVKIDFYDKYNVENERLLNNLIKCAFQNRRKMFVKNIKTSLNIEENKILLAFEKLGIDKNARGETLSVQQFVELSNLLSEN